jgi:hypothetical protein
LRDDVRRREIPRVHTIIEEASAPRPENLPRFGEQILAVDVQLDAIAVQQPLVRALAPVQGELLIRSERFEDHL